MYAFKRADGTTGFQCVDSIGVVEVRDKDTDDNTTYVIYWYIDRIEKGKEKIKRIQVWDSNQTFFYVQKDEGKLEIDTSEPVNPRPHIVKIDENGERYDGGGYGTIPFFRLDNCKKQFSDLKPIKALVDDYDLMACGLSNNLQDAAEYLVVVKGFQGDGLEELIQNVRTKKHIGVDGDDVDYKTVDIPYEARKAFLDSEKEVLKQLEEHYEEALAGIDEKLELLMARQDADIQHVIYQAEYQKALKVQVQSILEQLQTNEFDTISEYLANAYTDGYIGTMYNFAGQGLPFIVPIDKKSVLEAVQLDSKISTNANTKTGKLYTSLYEDITILKKKISGEISRGISGGMMYGEIARNISNQARIPMNNAMRIARTEAHRIQCKAGMDACDVAKGKGADVVKQWDSSLDKRTRKSHRRVDGEIRELDEKFSNGLKYPGDPNGSASEVVNCRCALLQRARWALDEEELKTLQERAKKHGLDKTDSFEEYKKKYLQESVRSDVQKSDESTTVGTAKKFDSAKSIKELNAKAQEEFSKYGVEVDFSGMDLDIAKRQADALLDLTSKYKTQLADIKTTGASKYLGNVDRKGNTYKDLTTAHMQISKKYGRSQDIWNEEVIKGIERGDSPIVDAANYDIYPVVHEFAHTLDNDYINTFYSYGNTDFWKEIEVIKNEYRTAYSRNNTLTLGKYATSNNDEFIAECFAEAMLSSSPSEYSTRTLAVIDKHFKKTDIVEETLENVGKSSMMEMNIQFFAEKSQHASERVVQRGITEEAINDALENPLHKGDMQIDSEGRKSIKYIGREATVCVNPDTDTITTTWKTGSRTVRKYEGE